MNDQVKPPAVSAKPLATNVPKQALIGQKPKPVVSTEENPDSGIPKVVVTHQVGKYEVRVIREKCIGAASCVAIAPRTFDLDEENIAIILDQHGDDDETRLLAAQSCPTAAIEVIDTETGEMVWPR